MSPNFFTVGPVGWGNQHYVSRSNSGYWGNSYENYSSTDIYSGRTSEATRNWMIAGLGLNVLGNILGQSDPDTGRILNSAGYFASGVGNIRMSGEMDQYHERVYNYGNSSGNWYNYGNGWDNNSYSESYNSSWGWNSGGGHRGHGPHGGHRGHGGHGGWQGNSAVDALNDWNYWPNGSSYHIQERYGWNNGGGWIGGSDPWLRSGPCF